MEVRFVGHGSSPFHFFSAARPSHSVGSLSQWPGGRPVARWTASGQVDGQWPGPPFCDVDVALFQAGLQRVFIPLSLASTGSLTMAQVGKEDILGKVGVEHSYTVARPANFIMDDHCFDVCCFSLI